MMIDRSILVPALSTAYMYLSVVIALCCLKDLLDDHIEKELDRLTANKKPNNPYLSGQKLPTVAKKGFV